MLEPTASRFWQATLQSGLADAATLRPCWDAIPPEKRVPEHIDRRLARQAVQLGVLTVWQAQQIMAGRSTGFKIDRYVLLELIGQGGMGRVYLARDSRLNRRVALKILSPERVNNPRAIARFHREALVGAQLQHENLVRIYDEGEANGKCYLVMEYIEGKNIGQMIAEGGPLPPAVAARLAYQVALGLEHAQRKGLIHRDVNPYNILVTRDGTAKLTDLGLAIDLAENDRVTRDGATVGTFDYVSPEQARHSYLVDTRSDIYSLGCTLYHMLTGRVPYPTASLPEKLFGHQAAEPEPLRNLAPGVPEGLAAVVVRTMRKQPEDRYATPLELSQALEPYADNAGGEEFHPENTPLLGQLGPSRHSVEKTITRQIVTPLPRDDAPVSLGINLDAPPATPPAGPATAGSASASSQSAVKPAAKPAPAQAHAPAPAPKTPAPEPAAQHGPLDLGINFDAPSPASAPTPTPAPAAAPRSKPAAEAPPRAPAQPETGLNLGINFDAPAPAPAPASKSTSTSTPAPPPPRARPEPAPPAPTSRPEPVTPAALASATETEHEPALAAFLGAPAAGPAPAPPGGGLFDLNLGVDTGPAPGAGAARSAVASRPAESPRVETPAASSSRPAPAPGARPRKGLAGLGVPGKPWAVPAAAVAGLLLIALGGVFLSRSSGLSSNPAPPTRTSDATERTGSAAPKGEAAAPRKATVPPLPDGKGFYVVGPDEMISVKPDLRTALNAAIGLRGHVLLRNQEPVKLAAADALTASRGIAVIRAGEGVRPVLQVEVKGGKPFLTTRSDSPLKLEGVTIEVTYVNPGKDPAPVILAGADVTLDRCALRVTNPTPGSRAVEMEGRRLTATGCWFEDFDQALDVSCFGESSTTLRHCMFVQGRPGDAKAPAPSAGGAVGLRSQPGRFALRNRRLTLERCTVSGKGFLGLDGFTPHAPITAEVTGCAVAADSLVAWGSDPVAPDVRPLDRATLIWSGRDNQYDVRGADWVLVAPSRGAALAPLADGPKTLDAWTRLVGNEVDPLPPPVRFATDPAALSARPRPADFAVADKGVRPVGADPSLVGPGSAPLPAPGDR